MGNAAAPGRGSLPVRGLLAAGVIALAACAAEPAGSRRGAAVLDAGPPMIPLAPRAEAPVAAEPPCDPAWREHARIPAAIASAVRTGATAVGGRLVLFGWGFAAATADDGTWVLADPSTVPGLEVARGRRIVLSHAVAHEGDVFVTGTRLAILRFDGSRWSMEHRNLRLGERRTHAATLDVCHGRLRATGGGAIGRRGDGVWVSLPPGEARDCPAEPLRTPRPSERCGSHHPSDRIVRCAAGARVWSARRGRWLALPDDVRWTHFAPILEPSDDLYLLAGPTALLHTADGAEWARVPLEQPVEGLALDGARLHAFARDVVYARDVCGGGSVAEGPARATPSEVP